jgi:hypothetical protein
MNKKKVLTIFKCSENCRFGEQTDRKIEMKNFGFSTFYIYFNFFFMHEEATSITWLIIIIWWYETSLQSFDYIYMQLSLLVQDVFLS